MNNPVSNFVTGIHEYINQVIAVEISESGILTVFFLSNDGNEQAVTVEVHRLELPYSHKYEIYDREVRPTIARVTKFLDMTHEPGFTEIEPLSLNFNLFNQVKQRGKKLIIIRVIKDVAHELHTIIFPDRKSAKQACAEVQHILSHDDFYEKEIIV